MLAWRNTQTLDGQAGMSKKATGVKRLGRFANTGGDCGSAKHGAIDFHVWRCLRQQTRGFRKELKKMWKSVKLLPKYEKNGVRARSDVTSVRSRAAMEAANSGGGVQRTPIVTTQVST